MRIVFDQFNFANVAVNCTVFIVVGMLLPRHWIRRTKCSKVDSEATFTATLWSLTSVTLVWCPAKTHLRTPSSGHSDHYPDLWSSRLCGRVKISATRKRWSGNSIADAQRMQPEMSENHLTFVVRLLLAIFSTE